MAKQKRPVRLARVVRSVPLPVALDRQIAKAARLTDESVVGFIRTAAEARAVAALGVESPDRPAA